MTELHIVSMKRGATSGSGSPLWRCETSAGQRVNIFQHADPSRDTYHLFAEAGYSAELAEMGLEEQATWYECPIVVTVEKDGQFWKITGVAARREGALPDAPYKLDPDFWERKAIMTARDVVSSYWSVYLDVETTGLDRNAEIISIAGVGVKMNAARIPDAGSCKVLFQTLVRPENLERVATLSEIHGLSAEALQAAPRFWEVYADHLATYVNTSVVRPVIYNASFDLLMLDLACERHGLPALQPGRVVDAMQIAAWYLHQYEPRWRNFKSPKLSEIAEALGVETTQAHDAAADAMTTFKVIRAIAAKELP